MPGGRARVTGSPDWTSGSSREQLEVTVPPGMGETGQAGSKGLRVLNKVTPLSLFTP